MLLEVRIFGRIGRRNSLEGDGNPHCEELKCAKTRHGILTILLFNIFEYQLLHGRWKSGIY